MAVAIDAAGLAEATGMDAAQATRLLPVVTARIEEYLGSAYATTPVPILDECAIRAAGYLAGQQYGAISETSVGPLTASYTTNHATWWRNSGAESLVSRYRVRRGGAA